LWAYVAGGTAVLLVTYVTARYAVLLVPAWCVFAGALGDQLLGCWRSLRAGLSCALGVATAAALQLSGDVSEASRMLERSAAAAPAAASLREARSRGDWPAAAEAFVRLQAAQPLFVGSMPLRGVPFESPTFAQRSAALALETFGAEGGLDLYMLASLSLKAELWDAAAQSASEAARLGYRSATTDGTLEPLLLEAAARRAAGDRAGADEALARALASSPGSLDVLAAAVAAAPDPARRAVHEARLHRLYDPLTVDYALARAYRDTGAHEQALRHADAVAKKLPDAAVVQHARALSLLALGREDEAFGVLARAFELFPGGTFAVTPFVPAVRALVSAEPPRWTEVGAEVLYRAGFHDESKAFAARGRGDAPVQAVQTP
ncbi:MAG: hypothetical protein ACK4N5_24125, partial [Myxococcales bacterium]